jgi:hypothetical protein
MIFLDSMSNLALPVAVCGLTGIILAITDPKRAQTKLTKERALLRCLMDAVSDLIFIKDRDGRRLLMDTLKAPYDGPDGEALGLVGIGRDITGLKRNNATNKVLCRVLFKEMEDDRFNSYSAPGR